MLPRFKCLCLLGAFLVGNAAFAEISSEFLKRRNEVKEWMNEMERLPPENFPVASEGHRKKLEQFIEDSRKICFGDLSPYLAAGEKVSKDVNASSKIPLPPSPPLPLPLPMEKNEGCFKELEIFEKTFIEKMLVARLRYLDYLHKKRTRILKMARMSIVKNLEQSYERKNRKNQRGPGGRPYP